MKNEGSLMLQCIGVLVALVLSACAAAPTKTESVSSEPLLGVVQSEKNDGAQQELQPIVQAEASGTKQRFATLHSLQRTGAGDFVPEQDLSTRFSEGRRVSLIVDELPLRDMIPYVLDDLLKTPFVMPEDVAGLDASVSLSAQGEVTERQLFRMLQELLSRRDIQMIERDGVFYLMAANGRQKSTAAIGVGARPDDVPNQSGQLVQIVPMRYGPNLGIERLLQELAAVKVSIDYKQSVIYLTGERLQILRAMELLSTLDAPAARGRHIGIIRLTYISPIAFAGSVQELMEAEGVPISIKPGKSNNIQLVSLPRQNTVVVFAAAKELVERVDYWARQLDNAGDDETPRYFVYSPIFARAVDLGESLTALFAGAAPAVGNQSRDTQSAINPKQTAADEDFKITADERSNNLILFARAKRYQSLLPLIQQLDVLPRQVVIEAVIAEVTLTDEFSFGVEWALTEGKWNLGTLGALGLGGGLGINYLDGSRQRVVTNMLRSNQLVNILSEPTIVVRDGIEAKITVGTEIPVVGETTTDPLGSGRQTTTVQYRQTGVALSVRPTVSARGLVVLEISKSISNTVDGSASVAGNPAIFEREISTEVVARDGQSILLGGLISESKSKNVSQVPILGKLPLLGPLFRSKDNGSTKTELVILVTARVLEQLDTWQHIGLRLSNGLKYLDMEAIEKKSGESRR